MYVKKLAQQTQKSYKLKQKQKEKKTVDKTQITFLYVYSEAYV